MPTSLRSNVEIQLSSEVTMEPTEITGTILKSSYLTRKIWRFGRSTSYFILRDNGKFYFYKNETTAKDPQKYKGFTNVKDVYIVPRGLKEFVIYTKNSVWYLKAKTSKDRDEWIEKLKSTSCCFGIDNVAYLCCFRAYLRMKDEEELKRILNAPLNQEEKLNTSKVITDIYETLQITYNNLRELK
uniref:PH domain-containing protein n=1 Tax=Elaeophora elaphi TaxID=1147741 RepID=A0A0R3S6K7_9BILA